jgi:hypothetical protein
LAIFRILGDCLLWVVFGKITEVDNRATFFHGKIYVLSFAKKLTGRHFVRLFANASGHPENFFPAVLESRAELSSSTCHLVQTLKLVQRAVRYL